MFLKPKSPLVKVPDPVHQGTPGYWLPPEGREVEPSMYWQRRLIDGDVLEASPLAASAPPAPAPEAAVAPPPAAA